MDCRFLNELGLDRRRGPWYGIYKGRRKMKAVLAIIAIGVVYFVLDVLATITIPSRHLFLAGWVAGVIVTVVYIETML